MRNRNIRAHIYEGLSTGITYDDSIIKCKQEGLSRFPYLNRFLAEEERVDVANAHVDIYELLWKRIGILKEI